MTLTILHAEDDRLVAGAVRLTLEAEGWRVVTRADGKAALDELAGPAPYALLVTDNELPRLGGVELIGCAQMLRHRSGMPVVMLTAGDCEREARRAGADAYLTKPEGVRELVPTIKRLLGSGRAS
ncbi:MAG TPA: response regulator [Pyrinomonadaceae bacterium]